MSLILKKGRSLDTPPVKHFGTLLAALREDCPVKTYGTYQRRNRRIINFYFLTRSSVQWAPLKLTIS